MMVPKLGQWRKDDGYERSWEVKTAMMLIYWVEGPEVRVQIANLGKFVNGGAIH